MQVIVTPKAEKHFLKLPKTERKKIQKKLLLMGKNPYVGKKLSGEFKEVRSLRVWPYRILYYINDSENKLFIISILHRQGAYI
jgi:mRNA-degrading endonuclease RelE of RelBE toxin-antitoxin system